MAEERENIKSGQNAKYLQCLLFFIHRSTKEHSYCLAIFFLLIATKNFSTSKLIQNKVYASYNKILTIIFCNIWKVMVEVSLTIYFLFCLERMFMGWVYLINPILIWVYWSGKFFELKSNLIMTHLMKNCDLIWYLDKILKYTNLNIIYT